MAVTHGDSLGDQTIVSLQVENGQWLQRSPHSATQVVRRTSVLCELTRMLLSEGGMPGMWPLGQLAARLMAKIGPPSVWRARLTGPPISFSVLGVRVRLRSGKGEATLKDFPPQEL